MDERARARMDLRPPAAVREIAQRLSENGFETWAVGGAVRDTVLGLTGGDWDLATRATPDDVRRLFRRTIPIGIEHGTVGVLSREGVLYEVTTFRRDVETLGRHAVVEFADTIEEDLARRDFTCNALAWNPLTGDLRDPFGGRDDLADGLLRTVGRPEERFAEDYLRVLRALRFAGQFDLRIEPRSWNALVAATPHLVHLSAERIREELWKILANTRTASTALALYAESGSLDILYPALSALLQLEADAEPPAGPWKKSLRAVNEIPTSRPALRLAALFHALGMPAARAPDLRGGWRYTGHEAMGARKAEELMRRLKASNAETERVVRLVRHQSDLFPPDSPDRVVRRWLVHVGADLAYDLFRLRFALWRAQQRADFARGEPAADARGGQGTPDQPADLLERWHHLHRVLLAHPPLALADLAISGRELKALGLQPGPRFGEILHALLDRVLDQPELNEPDTLIELARQEELLP